MTEIECKIINQLNKDLSLAGYTQIFSTSLSMKKNINKLISWVDVESEKKLSGFTQFLYSIDLDETHLKSENAIDNESLAWHILNRLKNKVINREKYSNI
ncbi:MAG: hypothetical protein P8L23_00870 [Flavobacteriales bacterium]|jgi:hypothetical protein|nr:hypothetical protein [Flavobacteriales bacterium]